MLVTHAGFPTSVHKILFYLSFKQITTNTVAHTSYNLAETTPPKYLYLGMFPLEKDRPTNPSQRLESLDALRGFDLFILTMLGPVMHTWIGHHPNETWAIAHWTHASWEGFLAWDLVMPLFMFMAGVSIPFAMSKYVGETASLPRTHALLRIFRRVIVLWLLGCIAQGNLLAFNLDVFKPLTNTLQAIAIGYAGAALAFLFLDWKKQLALSVALLAIFTTGCFLFGEWQTVGASPWTRELNFPATLDKICLGRWRDCARLDTDGNVIFPGFYDTAWIWCSMTFIVTVMSGVFTGILLKNKMFSRSRKFWTLVVAGTGLVALGWNGHIAGIPVIKRIWTGTFVLVSSGYCMLLMAVFYGIIDCLRWKRGLNWLKIIGMNSILAYMLSPEVGLVNFNGISHPLLGGLLHVCEITRPEIFFAVGNALILFLILWLCYRAKVFLKA